MLDSQEIKIKTNSLKYGKHYFIAYDQKDETLILKNIIKYYRNFIILRTDYITLFDNKNLFCFYYNAINLDLLFSDSLVISNTYAEQNKVILKNYSNVNYIYFYVIPDIINTIGQCNIKAYIAQFERIMVETICKYCVFDREVVVNNILFFKFADTISINRNKRTKFLFTMGGIGDFFITFSIISDYLNTNKYKDIYIINYSGKKSMSFEYMVKLCYGSKVKLLDYYHYKYFFIYWLEQGGNCLLYHKIITMFNLPKDKADNAAFLYKKILNGKINLDYYKYSDILRERIFRSVSSEEKNYIDSIVKNGNKNIGLQYFTGNFNYINNEWFFYGDRKWDEKNVREFIKKCKENNMNLIVLNSESYVPSLREFCTKRLSIEGYALLVSKMDLVVSVDSSAGHIAAFYNIPSITLWGTGSPLSLNHHDTLIRYVGYRPLRKNYSIMAKNKKISSIDYNTVFYLVKKFTENKLSFKDDIITYQDSLNGYNMLYI